ncbi:hypothetical protein [Phthorimaea operculella granulovirus]|uniref:Uncharacterized protein n=1 Tax=Phthorimaea operculella granulovirus TaxID=192584 RepID=Q8JRY3_9BBAC|nr:hypothetical protein [Phthorimaea operculella granulovirus]AAM70274.1 hypothetical protein [Phthorimaea operculella granulovirus]ANY57465.1 hypothetical protein PhopGVgp076 [Phthorimaea operculella granulovirus]QBH65911.1 hypothetical protein PhopGVgp076 [Phthorimaea operculella granulovirus]QBH66041.1 hypothetical protein PhopGVgp076 [Phthorimaea operculella granulovirus]QBH66171.1 hypothetical protein PhopGVgp076 [Phthorimaea operculella granulovirus]
MEDTLFNSKPQEQKVEDNTEFIASLIAHKDAVTIMDDKSLGKQNVLKRLTPKMTGITQLLSKYESINDENEKISFTSAEEANDFLAVLDNLVEARLRLKPEDFETMEL